jgi:hypothetical protein
MGLLVDGGVVGDLQGVLGAVESGLGVAPALVAFSGGGGDTDGFAVFSCPSSKTIGWWIVVG